MSRWIMVRAELREAPADWAPLIEVFREHGIEGTVQEDSPPSLAGYLAESQTDESQLNALCDDLVEAGAESIWREAIDEVDWAEAWKQFFKPMRLGRRLVIRPEWETFEAEADDIVIVLDPGQAFGTGDHPTTRMCLELLDALDLHGLDVADIGCGSGILAVAACRLGARSVVGVDIDGVAVEASAENAARNGVSFDVLAGKGFEPLPSEATYDLVVSNIISAALIVLAPEASRRVRPGGRWVVSGVIRNNWPDVAAAAERAGFQVDDVREEGDWVAASLIR